MTSRQSHVRPDVAAFLSPREAVGNVHGFVTLRQAIASSQGDVAGHPAAVKAAVVAAEGTRAMRQAAG